MQEDTETLTHIYAEYTRYEFEQTKWLFLRSGDFKKSF